DTGAVIHKDTLANTGGRVNIDLEQLRHTALEEMRHGIALVLPQTVGNAVNLKRQKALEEHKGLQIALGRRIAIIDGLKVSLRRLLQSIVTGVIFAHHFP